MVRRSLSHHAFAFALVLTAPVAALTNAPAADAQTCLRANNGSHSRIELVSWVQNGACREDVIVEVRAYYRDATSRYGHFEATGPDEHIGNSVDTTYSRNGVSTRHFFRHTSKKRGDYCVTFWHGAQGHYNMLDRNCTKL